jgi:hypothetical protein
MVATGERIAIALRNADTARDAFIRSNDQNLWMSLGEAA